MDEAIAIVDAGLRSEPLDHPGPRLVARDVTLGPRPVQQPRPPLWLGAFKPGGVRRAARWDGWIAVAMNMDGTSMDMTPAAFGVLVEVVGAERAAVGRATEPFDIAVLGVSEEGARPAPAFAEAGATWWLESVSPMRGSVVDLEAIVRAGPPR
jgi:alkanesulfonate monooxygenase SsuD/methylene tetrahydromethanopterin reductase-like flavin-dependent oxidoreductase (luciferase family)